MSSSEQEPIFPAGPHIIETTSFSFPLKGGSDDDDKYAKDTDHNYLVTASRTLFAENGAIHTSHHLAIKCLCCEHELVRSMYITTHALKVITDWARCHGTLECKHNPPAKQA